MSNNRYVLALYDIRAKQNFIFRTNHIKEIIGASAIIRDCFKDYLFPQAKRLGRGIFREKMMIESPFPENPLKNILKKDILEKLYMMVEEILSFFSRMWRRIETSTTFLQKK